MRDGFMIERHGKKYVLFAGLLDEAHERGLRSISTDLIQAPNDGNGNVAIVKAIVEMEDGRKFSGLGDASPDNVGRNIVPHLLRMAETRAKARALRDAVNVGITALEELGDDGESSTPSQPTGGRQRSNNTAQDGNPKMARKSQIDLLKTLAVEWRGEDGVERLENRIGKQLEKLTSGEANEWIDRLQPENQS